jgi:cytochrome c peroxidase
MPKWDKAVRSNKTETVKGAENVYRAVMEQLRAKESDAIKALGKAFDTKPDDVTFLHVAESIASFIRTRFRIKETQLHRFVFKGEEISAEALRGAQIFYGKGKCSICHSGAYLTDFGFHAIPMPQIGFGKNGFGVDYGRFNVTHDPKDLYKFRTPPLINVEKTAPYGHSGSVATLHEAIKFHSIHWPISKSRR